MPLNGKLRNDHDTVQRLLAAAAHEFSRRGFAATRIRDIVHAAGANLAAVNYHFGGKEGLYRATLAMLAKRAQEDMPGESPEIRALPPEDQLRAFARVMLMRHLGADLAAPTTRIVAHELLDPTAAFDAMLRDVVGPPFERLKRIVGALLGPRASEEEIACSSFSVAGQWGLFLFGRQAFGPLMPGIAGDAALLDRLASFSIAALRARRQQLENHPALSPAAMGFGDARQRKGKPLKINNNKANASRRRPMAK